MRDLAEGGNDAEGRKHQKSNLCLAFDVLDALVDHQQKRPDKDEFLAAGILCFQYDTTEQNDHEPYGATIEKACRRRAARQLDPEKNQNENCGWQNHIKLAG
ncbi:hypothetical protein D9M72_596540 [compost metagenome]